MHEISDWQHEHDFRSRDQRHYEQRTHWVIALTSVTMLVELVGGSLTGSMALLADGWHMATHVGALGIAAYAYRVSRRHAANPAFTFGTGKVATLGGFTSAIVLGVVALLMAVESVRLLFEPRSVHFEEAMAVALIGLVVNLLSAWLLRDAPHEHHHHHGHHEHDAHHAHHHDHNVRAAYLHVIADAMTSVLAIFALWSGARFGWVWMDPLMGIVGAVVISRWALGLAKDSGSILLDAEDHGPTGDAIRQVIEADSDTRVADLHVWRVGPQSLACIVSLVTHQPAPTETYKRRLAGIANLAHVTVEINHCTAESCPARQGGG
ncbi:CDF family Co(II)/Ni(II) efflux transporter DmeF [Thiosocius teredinicola]|uniref:CDF family Co(II)/Ni(II) efflux transporter DmeF n=1 Tax=Thiosocius teredinicola TaxID=1973002 RepID=UPI0009910734